MLNKILLLFLIITLFSANAVAKEQLIFSIDLIRHGDRTPLHQIPKSALEWKGGLGALTANGINQEQQLGTSLRKKYIDQYHLLPATYDSNTLYVRSTDKERAIKSADALLSGLYPSTFRKKNQEIPVNIIPQNQDNLLTVKPSRNIFSLIKLYVIKHSFWKNKTNSLQEKLSHWSEITGMQLNQFPQLLYLADNLYVREYNHLPLPIGISKKDADQIIALGELAIVTEFKLKEVSQPMGENFLKTVKHYFESAIQSKIPLRYVLFSGHDSTVMSVMNTLGTPLESIPNYASHLNFSLIKNENRYLIHITYNNKPIYLPGCNGNICTLAQFNEVIKNPKGILMHHSYFSD